MQRVESILVAVCDDESAREALMKAAGLARLFRARLELFRCNAEVAYFQRHQYEVVAARTAQERCAVESREHLEKLWNSLAVSDIPVTIDAACESPQYESIVRKVRHCRADLVVRGLRPARTAAGGVVDASDWDLVQACPAPLLLTRGRSWARTPRIAAAVDISGDESPELTRSILACARRFTVGSQGSLEILYADRFDGVTPQTLKSHRATLAERALEADVDPAQLHVLTGEPATVIPQFAALRGYDLLVVGALTHRRSVTALVGTLTGRLMETLDADLLLVRASPPRKRQLGGIEI
jgi:universal stress protein E